ncbi:MAG: pyridoxal phosphate-dependent aminotransferase [Syntrophales bacterium]|nr:pyridoxal phosphate-dependent aminotransferase [Syntrophales bacterium]
MKSQGPSEANQVSLLSRGGQLTFKTGYAMDHGLRLKNTNGEKNIMAIAAKIEGFISQSSMIRQMFEEGLQMKKLYGPNNVFDFSLGNPDVPPPDLFQTELRSVVDAEIPAKHAYMPNAGYPETRQAVALYLSGIHKKNILLDHIVMTCGAGAALNVILKTLLNPGEEVLAPAPCFVEYAFYTDNAGGVIKFVPSKDDFSLDLQAIEDAISEKTKAVLINSPNNPTGNVYNSEMISALAGILERKSRQLKKTIYLLSDEPYSDIIYDDVHLPSIFQAYANSIVASSYSKTLSLGGERIGYIAVNPGIEDQGLLLSGLIMCNRMMGFVNAPALMQRVVARLQGVKVDVSVYKRKRDLFYKGLVEAGYDIIKPEGAFYLFPKTPISDDVEFVQALKKRRILTVPGSAFKGPGHIRIAYCVDDAIIRGALEGFRETLQDYR